LPKLTIDGTELEVSPGTSILQACEQLGIEVPHFCYHSKLSVPANCRMCLVEMQGSPKPVASCAMPCADNMVIRTASELTHRTRQDVMEFLLINHPLDCPICDQGGECDLQDQALGYGYDRGRYNEAKRAVKDKYMGPLIKPFMTRCIQCTRCIRFADEIAGVPELGILGRSEDVEISTFVEKSIASELSGNLIDVCPVGALTSKPYAFAYRSWELTHTAGIDVMDAVGSNIRIDSRGSEVIRILPRLSEDINEEWIADKARFAYDGLKRQRLDRPYLRIDGTLQPVSWDEALDVAAQRLRGTLPEKIAAIAGDLVDCESVKALKDLMDSLGVNNLDCRQDGAEFDISNPAGYLFNSTIAGIEEADAILIVGGNLRWDAPMINARIRKRLLLGGLKVGVIGEKLDYTFPYRYLGAGVETLQGVAGGSHEFCDILRNATKPMIIVSASIFAGGQGAALQALCRTTANAMGMIKDGWNGFNVVHSAAGRVGALMTGFVPRNGGLGTMGILNAASGNHLNLIYLLGADEIDSDRLGNAFVIYQGHHGDRGAHRADLILPGAAYTEKNATYVNTEGRVQTSRAAVFPPGEAREDWKIIRALSEKAGHTLPYDSLPELRRAMAENEFFRNPGVPFSAGWGEFGHEGNVEPRSFVSAIRNFYMTDPISRASVTMAKCSQEFLEFGGLPKTGTEG
jgi:NADH-quinone oxidoreductase subunit G